MIKILNEFDALNLRCHAVDRSCAASRCMAWQDYSVQKKDGKVTSEGGYCSLLARTEDRLNYSNRGPG
jgi:hypothetical protein